jgi:hypothetical protein
MPTTPRSCRAHDRGGAAQGSGGAGAPRGAARRGRMSSAQGQVRKARLVRAFFLYRMVLHPGMVTAARRGGYRLVAIGNCHDILG